MTNPIHDAVLAEHWAQKALRDAERLTLRATRYIAACSHDPEYAFISTPAEGKTPMSALLDVETKIKDFGARVTADLQDLVTTAPPVIHDGAEALARLTGSKIVVELEQLTQPLDPALEELVAGMIRTAGDAAAKVASMTAAANPAPVETEPAAPAPADPQLQTGIAV